MWKKAFAWAAVLLVLAGVSVAFVLDDALWHRSHPLRRNWLDRARRFAVHALGQIERRGTGRYSLWTR